MRSNCIKIMGAGYLWLTFEILFFYGMIAFIICYFFRKHCQDPKVIKEAEDKEAEEAADRETMRAEGI